MGYYASGFCRLISHLLHGGAIHAWLLKTLTGISCMLIFFCFVANHYKCRSLRQTSVYYLTVSGMASLVSLLGSHGVESRSWPGGILTWSWHSFQSLFRLLAELGSLQLQTEVPIFLLTCSCSQASRAARPPFCGSSRLDTAVPGGRLCLRGSDPDSCFSGLDDELAASPAASCPPGLRHSPVPPGA